MTIALTGEQIVETLNWKHKVADAETASLLKLRGQSMQRAVPAGQGSMVPIPAVRAA